jgi:catechol 2,3-dioxygenase-like lactoylglutathione lyase family enzyme
MARKTLSALLLTAALWLSPGISTFPQSARPAATSSGVHIQAVGPIQMTVGDMDRSIDFYAHVLTFEKISDTEIAGDDVEQLFGVFGAHVRLVRMKLGEESIELAQFLAPRGRPIPADSHSNDLWFQHVAIIVSDMDRAYSILRQNKVEHASTAPQRLPDWNRNAAGIRAFYFKDPDGHPLEILEFPVDKGNPKWHRPSDRLFLGIDHTAIAVSDTDSSLKFYRDVFGFRVAGESENYGTEQEHLNNVFGAHLRITALRAPAGPGIELLEYLSPRDGRQFPADEHANDLVHRATVLITDDADTTARELLAGKAKFVSSGVVVNHTNSQEFRKAFQLRDPDGHPIEVAAH